MTLKLKRRQVLVCGSALACGACATMPDRFDRLPEGAPSRDHDRACDHDLCRYWRDDAAVPAPPPGQGEPRMGRCSVGLPEDL